MPKYLLLALVLSTVTLVVYTQDHGGGHGRHGHDSGDKKGAAPQVAEGRFPVVGFEASHEFTVPFPVSKVQPLFQPEWRHLLYKWWKPTVLRRAIGDTLKGLVTVSNMHGHDIFLIVTNHEPKKGHIQYLVLWDDFELQRIDITCVSGQTEGTTQITWKERNAGLHENGVRMVSQFVEGGHLEKVVRRYVEGAEKHLRKG